MKTHVITVRSADEVAQAAGAGALALKAGKLVAFGTETVYGVGAVATDRGAMDRLRELKSRPTRPFSVIVGEPTDVARYVKKVPQAARRLIEKAWPGPVTILLPTGGELADRELQSAGLYEVLCSDDTIGLRCSESALARAMVSAVDAPVVAPSANLAGQRSAKDADEVLASLDGRIDLLIDNGPARYGKDSTIVKFDGVGWQIVRDGVVDAATIRRLLRRTILFVCAGNTCRSPIAAGIARRILAERAGVPVADLAKTGMEVISAGLSAADGQQATPEAVRAARQVGADVSAHRSRRVTIELINFADLVFCMTEHQVEAVCQLEPSAAGKVHRLDGQADIPDPIGGGIDAYRNTAERIEKAILSCLDRELS